MSYLYGHYNLVTSLVYLEKYYLASASFDSNIKIWNYEAGEETKNFKGHSVAKSIVLLKNGLLASASNNYLIRVWNYSSGHLVGTYSGHSYIVICLCLLNNGSLVSASDDGDIRIWREIKDINNSFGNIILDMSLHLFIN
jgi:WD40 repeat protein